MADDESLQALAALHRDLEALVDNRLPALGRLVENLENHLEALKGLVSKKGKNDQSRKALITGKITVGDEPYEVNDDFKQEVLNVAEELDLDELEAAEYFMYAQQEAEDLDRPQAQTAVIRFHRRRELVLLCLRILMKAALDSGEDEVQGLDILQAAVEYIVGVSGTNNFASAYQFWGKCFEAMGGIERWLQKIAERLQSAQVVGQTQSASFKELMTFQLQSLTRQHECLAAICTHMIKQGFANMENLKALLARAKTIDKHDLITIHYVPMLIRLLSHIASEANTVTKDARLFHNSLLAARDNGPWALRGLHAATLAWWLAEYSGRYTDPNQQDADLQNVDMAKEAEERSEAFMRTLDDGAFHFMLSFSQDVRPTRWYDPQKTSMISSLLQDAAVLPPDSPQTEDCFRTLVTEQLQYFVDSFITNMPDTLRKLKAEEDDQRRRLHLHFQQSTGEYPLHLERFLVIVSYAYDGSPDAAEDFWSDKESNLYGFLQWAAKRQPTPRIAMFCEMLRAISTGNTNADSAHRFLLEEGASSTGKIRRISSLSYTHIFNELIEFQRNIHEPKKTIQGGLYAPSQHPADQIVEPESATMLESYLCLLAHLCRESTLARHFLLEHPDHSVAAICFSLCTDKVVTGLRAAAFDAASALLVDKDRQRASSMWNLLDDWTFSGFYIGSKQNAIQPVPRHELWATLAAGYDEALAFIRLLQALVEPYPDDGFLNDALPFPESLGSSRRMPGIESYIDFVMQVFADRTLEVQDPLQRHVLRWACLNFMVTSLQTFNEDLVVFANKAHIPVDEIIEPSSLAAYVTLHPFTRVMEWLFNDKVILALFASSHHDVAEVDAAPTDSPLVQSLMLSIEVMDLVMKLQATYLDIVRPLLKQQISMQRTPVSNLSLASFEDAVLNNLQIIVDLGLYCGTGHQLLTVASLQLLEKMASSRKLAVSPAGFGQRAGRSKIVGILEKDNEAERIGRSLSSLLQYDVDELSALEEAPGYVIKLRILEFLNGCLTAVSQRPTIAHILLGFSCENNMVKIAPDSLFENESSLFHAILLLAYHYPAGDGGNYIAWLSLIKTKCWEILQRLWRSPLTSEIVMEQMRNFGMPFEEALQLQVIDQRTPWDGMTLQQGLEELEADVPSSFFSGSSALALQLFLQRRAAFLDYESRELRYSVKEGSFSLRNRIQSLLLGTTVRPGEENVPVADVFNLFDFMEFTYPTLTEPQHYLVKNVDLTYCQESNDGVTTYSMPLLEQVMALQVKYLAQIGVNSEEEEIRRIQDVDMLMEAFRVYNRSKQLARYHRDILQSWVQLLMVTLHACEFDDNERTAFVLQTLQVILPKLELSYGADVETSLQLVTLAEALIQKIDFKSSAFEKTRNGDLANDRLSQLFRAALVGIYSPLATPELREYCYQICFRYIHGTFEKATRGSILGRHTLTTVKNCGTQLLDVVCDDAYSGTGTCRISALLLLSALVAVATRQESKYMLDTFGSLNFVGVLVDNIKHIPEELKASPGPQIPALLSYYDASLALLLRICQTHVGATSVLNAGLFPSIRDSRIFDVDPDIGLEFDDSNALKKYYELMLAVLRVINAAVLARGRNNEQTVYVAREFLKESRHSMVAIFKRSVNVGAGGGQDGVLVQDLSELVDCFTVLVEATGFLEFEDSSLQRRERQNLFS
ncbi:hypothetical protein BU23DRAFT_539607 [Bimuria novae-zelandiae CBS 107.79]|uniref:Nuclear pore complex subunit Nup192 n=1 Tax=Bimuria novae-zelandiae CBS 107.79 TaxID=1447943 RepID=A0A6A5UWB6_9PLEO|nr:hypothetical protein BU23DRAFT_539607 [Bimuria novae-zelandiae CBS 107.79]